MNGAPQQLQAGAGGHRSPVMTIFFPVVCLWKRYYYYLTHGIRKDMIAPEESGVMVRVSKLISNALLTSPSLEPLMTVLMEEKENDYYNSLKKSIGEVRWKREGVGPLGRAPFFPPTIRPPPWFLWKCRKHHLTV